MTQVSRIVSKPRALVVVAHPDDESFGLGAVILWLRRQSIPVSALIFTQGEASTLGNSGNQDELRACRCEELACAVRILGLTRYVLHPCPDGCLAEVPLEERVQMVEEAGPAEIILAFDETGITGHQDHIAATEAAETFAMRHKASLYFWTLPEAIATTLNARFATSFQGRPQREINLVLDVSRERPRQWQAIHCHRSQTAGLDVVQARLELLGSHEYLLERSRGSQKLETFF
jgi:LmbE family N-acetylglucosaminyl deacetylase